MRLRGSCVLVTGGASGIGRLMALGAARRGADVVVWDLAGDRAAGVAQEVRSLGRAAEALAVDVSDPAAVRAAASETVERVGRVDVVVNNAGVVTGRPLLEADEEAIARTYGVNVLALYWVTRAFLPAMVARRSGSVVTVASAAGLVGVARQTDYAGSKHAAVGFAESLRAEMRAQRTGVHTLVVRPYYIDTGMFAGVRTRFPLLLPILQEERVAQAVLDAVESGRQQLSLPPVVGVLPVLRALPVRAFDAVMDVVGVNRTMDHFTGR